MKTNLSGKNVTLAAVFAIAFAAMPAWAGDLFPPPGAPASTMKRLDKIDSSVCIDSLPFSITAPGVYRVCGSLTGVAGQPGITIMASDVTIDGCDRTLTGVPGSLQGVLVEGLRKNVVIRNLSVHGWGGHGLDASFSEPACVSVRCDNNGGDGFRMKQGSLTDCVATDNMGNGVHSQSKEFTGHVTVLKRCESSRNGASGVVLVAGPDEDCDGDVDDCVFNGNGVDGISVQPGSATNYTVRLTVRGSVCHDNKGVGVHFDGLASSGNYRLDLRDTSASGNGAEGMRSSGGGGAGKVSLQDFHFVRNAGPGMHVTCPDGGGGVLARVDVDVCRGSLDSNTGDGALLRTRGRATMQDMSFRNNSGNGLSMNCPGTLESCDSSSNGLLGVEYKHTKTGHVSLLKRVAAINNSAGGVLVTSDEADTTASVLFNDSVCSSNGGPGIEIRAAHTGVATSVELRACDADNNGGAGLLISPIAMDKGLRFRVSGGSYGGNTLEGISVSGGDAGVAYIGTCDASRNGGAGISVRASSLQVERCSSAGNGGDGISLSGAGGSVCDNVCSSNNGRGITINTSHVEYATNRCSSNGGDGFDVASGSGNVLRGNFVSGNSGNGVSMRSSGNPLFESSSGSGANPLFTDAGVISDIAPASTAAAGGPPNLGF
jgi:hypothetical protein